MKEIKLGHYSSMSEMVAELNAKIPTAPNIINLHSDGFNVHLIMILFPTSQLWLCLTEYQ